MACWNASVLILRRCTSREGNRFSVALVLLGKDSVGWDLSVREKMEIMKVLVGIYQGVSTLWAWYNTRRAEFAAKRKHRVSVMFARPNMMRMTSHEQARCRVRNADVKLSLFSGQFPSARLPARTFLL